MNRSTHKIEYSEHMVDYVESHMLAGLVSNDEIASVLRSRYWPGISASHVARWRDQHPRFDRVCTHCLNDANAKVTSVLYNAAIGGDLATARYWADRRIPAFMPKSKQTLDGRVNTLDETLKRRGKMTEDEERERGLVEDLDDE